MTFVLKKKKIGLVANTAWSIYNFRLTLIKTFQENGFDVLIIAPPDEFSEKLIEEGCIFQPVEMSARGTSILGDFKIFSDLQKIYRSESPDFIFHYTIKPNIYGSMAAWISRTPSIAVTTGLGYLFLSDSKLIKKIAALLYKFGVFFSKEVWFLNVDDRKFFIDQKIVPAQKTMILPGEGINLNFFKRKTVYPKFDTEEIIFLFVGRLIWEKGIREFISAAKAIRQVYPKVRFQILGFGAGTLKNSVPVETVEEWKKDKSIEFLGGTHDVKSFLEKVSCLVLPSYREGISRVLMEAASMELPIVTTNTTGCREVVEDGYNGFLCKVADAKSLEASMMKMIEIGHDEREKLGKNGRIKAEKELSEEKIIEYYFSAIKKYLN